MTTETILTPEQIDILLEGVLRASGSSLSNYTMRMGVEQMRGAIRDIEQAVLQSQRGRKESKHPDDAAVDEFAAAMKSKLAKKRAEGRGGWQDMSATELSELLHEHVEKGDPLDVANLAMMLHQNGQPILQSPEIQALRKDAKRYRAARAALIDSDNNLPSRLSDYAESNIKDPNNPTEDDIDAAFDDAMEQHT